MQVKCIDCKYWQGSKHAPCFKKEDHKWGDCFRVIETLEPRLMNFTSRLGYRFNTPFDPHDAKYFIHNPGFYKLYKKLSRAKTFVQGVRLHKIHRSDTVFNNQTGEFGETKVVPLYYYQTRYDFGCQEGDIVDGMDD